MIVREEDVVDGGEDTVGDERERRVPEEVERALAHHPDVREITVVHDQSTTRITITDKW